LKNDADLEPVTDAFSRYDSFIILGHEEPDADCLGSQLALGMWLEEKGKKIYLCSKGPWERDEIAGWEKYFSGKLPNQVSTENTAAVILDCSSLERTGFSESELPDIPYIVIDHHAAGSSFGDIRYINPLCPSTTLLIQKIIEKSGGKITKKLSEPLFLGFCTDTGFFRHLEPGRAEPLLLVSRLIEAGASPPETFRAMSGGGSLNSRILLGRLLERSESYFHGRLIITWENWKDWREIGSKRDSDMLYQLLTGINGVEAVAVIREQNDGYCNVGLRSTTELNVAEIARFFGGGGHKKAAGCTISGDRHDIIEHLLQIFADRLKS